MRDQDGPSPGRPGTFVATPGKLLPRRFLKAEPTTKLVPEPFRVHVMVPPDVDDLAALTEPHAEHLAVLDPNKVPAVALAVVFFWTCAVDKSEAYLA